MPRYKCLQEDQRNKRRGVADVIEVLLRHGAFDHVLSAQIRVGRLRLPSEDIVGLVGVFAESAAEKTTFIVTLPSSKQFRAKRQGSPEIETFDIFRLHEATVDGNGAVELANGARLRAVEVKPALLPYTVTDLDFRILHRTIEFIEAEQECYTYPIHFERPAAALDCSTLAALRGRIPLLKELEGYIADEDPGLQIPSEQQIANTLRKFGMRIPSTRSRRARRPGAAPSS